MSQVPPPAQLAALQNWLRQFPSILVAYSGGVDSALLMAVAHQTHGPKAVACIGVSPSYPQREMKAAIELATARGANIRTLNTEEHLDANYAANPDNRCYYCKSDLFNRLQAIAQAEGYAVILDGNNADDTGDDRPGHIAAQERGVRSPLQELGITKQGVRDIAKLLGLPVWDKPAMACLSSRVPHGTPIVPQLLGQIEKAEDVLADLGFRQFRVRHHGDLARIELLATDLPRTLELREQILGGIRAAGYRHVTIDLAPFQSGSFHQATKREPTPVNIQKTESR